MGTYMGIGKDSGFHRDQKQLLENNIYWTTHIDGAIYIQKDYKRTIESVHESSETIY